MKTTKLEQRGTPIQIDPQKGETIEMKVRRITQNKEPITDVAQPIYMERGVKMASCDIRTDRWEIAREAKKHGKTGGKKMKTPKLEQRGTPIQIDPQKGETIEMKVRRITQNKEPITDVAQPIYMERGVKMASCDIRIDRWEVAREAKLSGCIVTGKQIGRAHV